MLIWNEVLDLVLNFRSEESSSALLGLVSNRWSHIDPESETRGQEMS